MALADIYTSVNVERVDTSQVVFLFSRIGLGITQETRVIPLAVLSQSSIRAIPIVGCRHPKSRRLRVLISTSVIKP